tara:strand:+ start:223 stop:753 length:531 start_codon:yes stop_codon:yes gene_type:complete
MADVSFDSQVKFLAGATTDYTAELPQFYSDGVRDVIQRIAAVKPELLKQFSTSTGVPTQGYALASTAKILDVHLAGFSAREIEPQERFNAWDVDSIYYAHTTAPVYYIMNQTLFTVPGGDTDFQAPSDNVVDACILERNGQSSSSRSKNKQAQQGSAMSTSTRISRAVNADEPVSI